jgi:hypothetical protein
LFVAASTRTSTFTGLAPADSRDHAVLQHAQHLRLRGRRHVAHLVEEERAGVGLLELAGAVLHGAGERPLHVPEQLALDELGRDGGAVDLHERPRLARRVLVEGARHQLLTRAVLSGDEHARRRGRHPLHLVEQGADEERPAHHLVPAVDRLAEARVLGRQLHPLQRVPQQQEHAVGVERLLEEVIGTRLGGLHRRLDGAVAGDHHDDGVRVELLELAQRVEPVEARHLDVHEHEVRPEPLVLGEPLGRARRGAHVIPFVLQQLAERVAHAGLVVDDQDAAGHQGGVGVGVGPALYSVTRPRAIRTSPM